MPERWPDLPAGAPERVPGRGDDAPRVLDAALAIIDQGTAMLESLSASDYSRKVPLAFNGSIGGHYRHCLDHFRSFLRALEDDLVDYDHRDRDVRIETDPGFARQTSLDLRARLAAIPPGRLHEPVAARCEVSYAQGQSPVTGSSFGRELVYVIAHAIHHFALISIMARGLEVALPAEFGIAPSTLAHHARQDAVLGK